MTTKRTPAKKAPAKKAPAKRATAKKPAAKKAPPKGQNLKAKPWERVSVGRPRKYQTAQELWEAAVEYFQWCEANPIFDHKVTQYQGDPIDVSTAIPRAMTIGGLCIHIGVNHKCMNDIMDDIDINTEEGRQFSETIGLIREVIRDQKFAGAAAGIFNSNIIARDLGLVDKQDHKQQININITDKDAEL